LLDQPDIIPSYIPFVPDSAFRPALGFGVTPFTGLRFGFSYTEGPYLNRQLGAYLPPGADWRDFDQRILGFDVQFSRGYLELNGQLVVSKYDVPFRDVEVGLGYRFSPNTQLKVAYRRDHWDSQASPENSIRNGYSLALQLSHHFDLRTCSIVAKGKF
jgi:hypothetical protein